MDRERVEVVKLGIGCMNSIDCRLFRCLWGRIDWLISFCDCRFILVNVIWEEVVKILLFINVLVWNKDFLGIGINLYNSVRMEKKMIFFDVCFFNSVSIDLFVEKKSFD